MPPGGLLQSRPRPRAALSLIRIEILLIASCRSKGVVKIDGTLRVKTGNSHRIPCEHLVTISNAKREIIKTFLPNVQNMQNRERQTKTVSYC